MENTALKTELTDAEMQDILRRVEQLQNQGSDTQEQSPEDLPHFNEADLVDEYGLPFEPEGYYNAAPLQFEETVSYLWYFVDLLHYAATRYNRHSPNYFTLLKELEKDIKKLGQYCITRAVMEKSGASLEKIGKTPIRELYCMVSLHFRKCCTAAYDIQKEKRGVDVSLIGWMFRLANLAERLKATEDKIQKIKDGKISIEKLLEPTAVYKNEPKMQEDKSAQNVQPSMRAPSSMSVIKSFSKEVKQEKQKFEKEEKKKKREAERAAKRVEKSGLLKAGTYEPKTYPPIPLPKIPGIGLGPKELKKLLMDEAKSRGDMAEAGIIAAESIDEDIQRFLKMRGHEPGTESQRSGPSQGSDFKVQSSNNVPNREIRTGPSDETRKKLRAKRKRNRG
ncbi:MAG: hypothetical protein IJI41_13845 [Anaerolineaceae bacterium]|nr:hypothetical protein [Anaerolineaceae bacterium]